MRYVILFSAMILIFLLTVSSCGRKGDPIPPDKITSSKITMDMIREGGSR